MPRARNKAATSSSASPTPTSWTSMCDPPTTLTTAATSVTAVSASNGRFAPRRSMGAEIGGAAAALDCST
jgi:hypothetical protein